MVRPASASGLRRGLSTPEIVAEAQGWFNIIGGAWPLLGLRSFEAVFGPKTERWLEYSVSGLLIANGACQLAAARRGDLDAARQIGCGTAGTLLLIDAVFVPAGRIRWTYLLDAVVEAGWLALWAGTGGGRSFAATPRDL